ncbi:MAG: carbohydrate kinase family protein [Egibacteraceae bacterium]
MSCPRLDLVCFSYLAYARVLRIAHHPDANGGAEVTEILHSIAGDGPMVAAHAGALGLAAGLVANAVGDDPEGRLALGYLERHRLAHRIEVRPGADTPTLVVLSDQAGNRTWFAHLPGVRDTLVQADGILLGRGRLAYVDGYPVIEDAAIRAVHLVHQAGVPVFCNLGGAPPSPRLAAALRGARLAVVQTSLDETSADQADAVAEGLYARLGPDVAVVTCGALGAVARAAAGLCQASAPKILVHQAHGAGAAFSAGLAYGYLRGWGPVDALRFACRLGSLRCAVPLHVETFTTIDMVHRLSKEVNELEVAAGPAGPAAR